MLIQPARKKSPFSSRWLQHSRAFTVEPNSAAVDGTESYCASLFGPEDSFAQRWANTEADGTADAFDPRSQVRG